MFHFSSNFPKYNSKYQKNTISQINCQPIQFRQGKFLYFLKTCNINFDIKIFYTLFIIFINYNKLLLIFIQNFIVK